MSRVFLKKILSRINNQDSAQEEQYYSSKSLPKESAR
jgi:hypothetical protein